MKIVFTTFLIVTSALIQGTKADAQNATIQGSVQELRRFFDEPAQTVSLTAEVRHQVQADQAVVELTVTSEGKNLSEGLGSNRQSRDMLSAALIGVGIAADKVVASRFTYLPESGILSKKIRSYKVVGRLRVTLANESQFEAVAGILDQRDEWEYRSVEMIDSKEAENKAAALEKAFAEIERKKEVYERRLQLKLAPLGFREHQPPLNQRGGLLSSGAVKVQGGTSPSYLGRPSSVGETNVGQQFGQLAYTVHLTVDYQVQRAIK